MKRLRWIPGPAGFWHATLPRPCWVADEEAKTWNQDGYHAAPYLLEIELECTWFLVRVLREGERLPGHVGCARSLARAKRIARAWKPSLGMKPFMKIHWIPEPDRVPGFGVEVTFSDAETKGIE